MCAGVVFLVNFPRFISQTHDIRFALLLFLNSFPDFLSLWLCCRLSCSSLCLVLFFFYFSSCSVNNLPFILFSYTIHILFLYFISILFAYVCCFFMLSLSLLMYPATFFYLSKYVKIFRWFACSSVQSVCLSMSSTIHVAWFSWWCRVPGKRVFIIATTQPQPSKDVPAIRLFEYKFWVVLLSLTMFTFVKVLPRPSCDRFVSEKLGRRISSTSVETRWSYDFYFLYTYWKWKSNIIVHLIICRNSCQIYTYKDRYYCFKSNVIFKN